MHQKINAFLKLGCNNQETAVQKCKEEYCRGRFYNTNRYKIMSFETKWYLYSFNFWKYMNGIINMHLFLVSFFSLYSLKNLKKKCKIFCKVKKFKILVKVIIIEISCG